MPADGVLTFNTDPALQWEFEDEIIEESLPVDIQPQIIRHFERIDAEDQLHG